MIMRPHIWLSISLTTIVVSVAVIVMVRPLWGIDFTGGTLLEISTNGSVAEVRSAVGSVLGSEPTVQATQENTLLLRMPPLSETEHQSVISALEDAELLHEELRFESIGPTIGSDLRRQAWMAVAIVVGVMIVYLAYEYRQSRSIISPWKYGLASAFALVHDLVVVTAIFVMLGRFFGASIDALFVTAMLAILGYSVNDTIVIFNRLNKEWLTKQGGGLLEAMDRALKVTLMRSLNTALTTLVVLIALLLFGGSTILWFAAALALGTIFGSYSSLFVAPPALYYLSRSRR